MNFSQTVLNWYHHHKRDLPWRSTSDPYIIWLSEIILQQTRVEQGLPYFHKFAEAYPTVRDFASATEDEILKNWQGLGYYSRGRNMHKTARMVMEDHAGYFPSQYDKLIRLKGIGEYTAAAISSFAANEAKAVVDGNVFRLLARYFGIAEPINTPKGKRVFADLANQLIDITQPGIYNQAVMEFGALQCKPRNPDCSSCPLNAGCVALKDHRINELPVKIRSRLPKSRYFNYLVIVNEGQILIHKRTGNDIWRNLYEFPMIETAGQQTPEELLNEPAFVSQWGTCNVRSVSVPVKHQLSHQTIFARFIEIAADEIMTDTKPNTFWINVSEVDQLAVPKLIFDYFKKFLP
ncbi:MAG TPA: A/G-specific adenine glycosylase [Sphingobacteriaceae bacterium]